MTGGRSAAHFRTLFILLSLAIAEGAGIDPVLTCNGSSYVVLGAAQTHALIAMNIANCSVAVDISADSYLRPLGASWSDVPPLRIEVSTTSPEAIVSVSFGGSLDRTTCTSNAVRPIQWVVQAMSGGSLHVSNIAACSNQSTFAFKDVAPNAAITLQTLVLAGNVSMIYATGGVVSLTSLVSVSDNSSIVVNSAQGKTQSFSVRGIVNITRDSLLVVTSSLPSPLTSVTMNLTDCDVSERSVFAVRQGMRFAAPAQLGNVTLDAQGTLELINVACASMCAVTMETLRISNFSKLMVSDVNAEDLGGVTLSVSSDVLVTGNSSFTILDVKRATRLYVGMTALSVNAHSTFAIARLTSPATIHDVVLNVASDVTLIDHSSVSLLGIHCSMGSLISMTLLRITSWSTFTVAQMVTNGGGITLSVSAQIALSTNSTLSIRDNNLVMLNSTTSGIAVSAASAVVSLSSVLAIANNSIIVAAAAPSSLSGVSFSAGSLEISNRSLCLVVSNAFVFSPTSSSVSTASTTIGVSFSCSGAVVPVLESMLLVAYNTVDTLNATLAQLVTGVDITVDGGVQLLTSSLFDVRSNTIHIGSSGVARGISMRLRKSSPSSATFNAALSADGGGRLDVQLNRIVLANCYAGGASSNFVGIEFNVTSMSASVVALRLSSSSSAHIDNNFISGSFGVCISAQFVSFGMLPNVPSLNVTSMFGLTGASSFSVSANVLSAIDAASCPNCQSTIAISVNFSAASSELCNPNNTLAHLYDGSQLFIAENDIRFVSLDGVVVSFFSDLFDLCGVVANWSIPSSSLLLSHRSALKVDDNIIQQAPQCTTYGFAVLFEFSAILQRTITNYETLTCDCPGSCGCGGCDDTTCCSFICKTFQFEVGEIASSITLEAQSLWSLSRNTFLQNDVGILITANEYNLTFVIHLNDSQLALVGNNGVVKDAALVLSFTCAGGLSPCFMLDLQNASLVVSDTMMTCGGATCIDLGAETSLQSNVSSSIVPLSVLRNRFVLSTDVARACVVLPQVNSTANGGLVVALVDSLRCDAFVNSSSSVVVVQMQVSSPSQLVLTCLKWGSSYLDTEVLQAKYSDITSVGTTAPINSSLIWSSCTYLSLSRSRTPSRTSSGTDYPIATPSWSPTTNASASIPSITPSRSLLSSNTVLQTPSRVTSSPTIAITFSYRQPTLSNTASLDPTATPRLVPTNSLTIATTASTATSVSTSSSPTLSSTPSTTVLSTVTHISSPSETIVDVCRFQWHRSLMEIDAAPSAAPDLLTITVGYSSFISVKRSPIEFSIRGFGLWSLVPGALLSDSTIIPITTMPDSSDAWTVRLDPGRPTNGTVAIAPVWPLSAVYSTQAVVLGMSLRCLQRTEWEGSNKSAVLLSRIAFFGEASALEEERFNVTVIFTSDTSLLDSALGVTQRVALALSIASIGTSSPSQSTRTATLQQLSNCAQSSLESGILNLAIGDDGLSIARGSVVGNLIVVMVAAAVFLALACALLLSAWWKRRRGTPPPEDASGEAPHATLRRALLRLRLPSSLLPALFATTQSSLAQSVLLVVTPDVWYDTMIGVVGLVVWLGVVVAVVVGWRTVVVTHEPREVTVPRFAPPRLRKALLWALHHNWTWKLKEAMEGSPEGVTAAVVVKGCHVLAVDHRLLWFAVLDAGLTAVCALLSAVPIVVPTTIACIASTAVTLALYLLQLLACIMFWPLANHFGNVYFILYQTLLLLCGALQIAEQQIVDSADGTSDNLELSSRLAKTLDNTASAIKVMLYCLSIGRMLVDGVSAITGARKLLADFVAGEVDEHEVVDDEVELDTPIPMAQQRWSSSIEELLLRLNAAAACDAPKNDDLMCVSGAKARYDSVTKEDRIITSKPCARGASVPCPQQNEARDDGDLTDPCAVRKHDVDDKEQDEQEMSELLRLSFPRTRGSLAWDIDYRGVGAKNLHTGSFLQFDNL